jgi:hypothetical protein
MTAVLGLFAPEGEGVTFFRNVVIIYDMYDITSQKT